MTARKHITARNAWDALIVAMVVTGITTSIVSGEWVTLCWQAGYLALFVQWSALERKSRRRPVVIVNMSDPTTAQADAIAKALRSRSRWGVR